MLGARNWNNVSDVINADHEPTRRREYPYYVPLSLPLLKWIKILLKQWTFFIYFFGATHHGLPPFYSFVILSIFYILQIEI